MEKKKTKGRLDERDCLDEKRIPPFLGTYREVRHMFESTTTTTVGYFHWFLGKVLCGISSSRDGFLSLKKEIEERVAFPIRKNEV
jgi:hypothetical protein